MIDEGRFGGRQPQAVRNALSVLAAVVRLGPGVTVKQVSSELGMAPATAYRIISLLVAEEYLVRLPDLRGLALGARMEELAPASSPPRPAEPVTLPLPTDLSAVERLAGLPPRLQPLAP